MTKVTDYGLVLLTHLARQRPGDLCNARALAAETRLPVPMVSRICKLLVAGGLLEARRGVGGGFTLARIPAEITVAGILEVLEGPLALTECSQPASHESEGCEREEFCSVRDHTQRINQVLWEALGAVTLADLARPITPQFFTLDRDALPARIAATPACSSPQTAVASRGVS